MTTGNKSPKAVIYARVSTDYQDTANQVDILTAWAKHRDYDLVAIYRENETAWHSGHQAELARLIADAQRGKFQVVMVWALDRLSREGALAILQLVHKLNAWGIKLLSYQEPWTEAPGELADLLFALTGWVARMESARRSERTKAGIATYRRQYGRWGRPPGSRDKKQRKRRVR